MSLILTGVAAVRLEDRPGGSIDEVRRWDVGTGAGKLCMDRLRSSTLDQRNGELLSAQLVPDVPSDHSPSTDTLLEWHTAVIRFLLLVLVVPHADG